ncbi:MAG TPA: hypothetical protein VJG29_00925 [Candidatus Paceibacterota bacterium]
MSEKLFKPGVAYLTSTEAGKKFGVTHDYVTRLCRQKKTEGVFVGRTWYVAEPSLKEFLEKMEKEKEKRNESLHSVFKKETVPKQVPEKNLSLQGRSLDAREGRVEVTDTVSKIHTFIEEPRRVFYVPELLEKGVALTLSLLLVASSYSLAFTPSYLSFLSHEVSKGINTVSSSAPDPTPIAEGASFMQQARASLSKIFTPERNVTAAVVGSVSQTRQAARYTDRNLSSSQKITRGFAHASDTLRARQAVSMATLRSAHLSLAALARETLSSFRISRDAHFFPHPKRATLFEKKEGSRGETQDVLEQRFERLTFAVGLTKDTTSHDSSYDVPPPQPSVVTPSLLFGFFSHPLLTTRTLVAATREAFTTAFFANPERATSGEVFAKAWKGLQEATASLFGVAQVPAKEEPRLVPKPETNTSEKPIASLPTSPSVQTPRPSQGEVSPRPAPPPERTIIVAGVTQDALDLKLQELTNSIKSEIYRFSSQSSTGISNNFSAIALTQKIDHLDRATLNDVTFAGSVSGLTNEHIPDDITASNYLALTGGTLTGALTSYSVVTAPSFVATSTTATSTFAGGFAVQTSGLVYDFQTSRVGIGTASPSNTLSVSGGADFTENVGIGTTSPYAKLSVVGEAVAAYFTATTTSTSTFGGSILVTKTPGVAHSFSPWAINAAGASPLTASLIVNPSSAASDTNLFALSVAGNAKFLIDAEGDVFANSITAVGGVTLSTTQISTLTVEGVSTLGDATTTDRVYFNSRIGSSLIPTVDNGLDLGSGSDGLAWRTGYFGTSIGIGTTSPYAALSVAGASGVVANVFSATSTAATSTFAGGLAVETSGFVYDYQTNRVGIGTTTPLASLDIYGNLSLDGPSRYVNFGSLYGTGSTGYGLRENGGQIEFRNFYASTTALSSNWTPISSAASVRYSLDESSWITTGATLPASLSSAQIAVIGDYIYLFGGESGGETNVIYRAPVSNPTSWSNTGATLPGVLSQSQSAIIGDYVYLFGGSNGSETNVIYRAPVSDPTSWSDTGSTLPGNLRGSSLAVIGDYIYLFGGISGGSGTNVIYRARVSNPTSWSNTGATLPSALSSSRLLVIGDYAYLFSGYGGSGGSSIVYRAPVSNPTSWSNTGATLPGDLAKPQGAIIGDYAYLFGGESGLNTNVIYRAPVSNPTSWIDTKAILPTSLASSHLAVIGEHVYLFGGSSSNAIYRAIISNNANLNQNWAQRFNAPAGPWFIATSSNSNLSYTSGNVGIGTTSPYAALSVAGASGVVANIFSATSTTATSTFLGALGIGTSTPAERLSVAGRLYVGGTGTSTIENNLHVRGTLQTGTGSVYITDSGISATTFSSTAATATSFFATTASSTNFVARNATTTNFEIENLLRVTNASATSTFAGGLAIETSGLVYDFSTNRVGIGTASPAYELDVTGQGRFTATSTASYFAASSLGAAGAPAFTFSGDPNTGLWSSTADTLNLSTAGSERLRVDSAGLVGIGTTTPWKKLSVTNTAADAQFSISYDSTRYANLQVDSVGDFIIDAQGGDVFLSDENLFVCTGGSCPSGSPSGTGNLITETRLGVGTSTPAWNAQIAGTRASLAISDSDAGTDLKHWLLSSMGGSFYLGTTTDAYATATTPVLSITSNGKVGIGTTSPTQQFSVSQNLFVGNSGVSTLGQATSTFQGDIRIIGKLDVSTIDPVYTIDGVKYATYGHSTIGVKEEVIETLTLSEFNPTSGYFEYRVAFEDLAKGSNLWLFYQVTDFGEGWNKLAVSLTASFAGEIFYTKLPDEDALLIKGSQAGEISARLVADRYDAGLWPNLRPDQNDPYTGHELVGKENRVLLK